MNILFIVTLSELGGAQKYVRDLALAYAKQGHRVAIAAGPDRKNTTGDRKRNWLFKELLTFLDLNISIYSLLHLKRSTGLLREFQTLFDIIRIIKHERPDVIHLNSTKIGGLGGLAGRLAGVQSVYTVHGLVLNEPLPILLWLFYWLLEKIAFALCNKIIVISKFDQQRVIDLKLAPIKKLALIPLAIDPDALNFLSREEARQEINKITDYRLPITDYQLIGTIANFYPTKDLPTLIEAARLVVKEKSETRFAIIGDGPLRKNLELQITNYELQSHVFLLGSIENASRFITGFDLFVLSSVKEGLPQVLQEAVAAGISIVSTNIGGIPDIIKQNPNHPWAMVKPKNLRLLAEAIISTLNNLQLNTQKTKTTLKKRELLDQEFQLFTNQSFSTYEEKQ